jgi:hypothetical protein
VRQQVDALPWPHEKRVSNRLLVGRLQRVAHQPRVFTVTAFPVLFAAALLGTRPDLGPRERPCRLDTLPDAYLERFSNVQASIGLAGLELLDSWTAATRSHSRTVSAALADLPGVQPPSEPPERTHAYHRYSVRVPKPLETMRYCLRHGVDLGGRHADFCPRLEPLAAPSAASLPGAEAAIQAVHVPVYASLSDVQTRRVAKVVRDAVAGTPPRDGETVIHDAPAPAGPPSTPAS